MKLKQDTEIMWQPTSKNTKIEEFRSHVNRKFSLGLEKYQDLWEWSIEQYDIFWAECWDFLKIKHSVDFSKVVDTSRSIQEIPEWFYDAKLNYAENLLQGNDEDVALIIAGERRKVEKITFKELRGRVSVLKSALESIGVKPGDRVAGYIPNCSLAVEAMLATSAIGAIWTSTSPDFGVTGVLERFSQINPKVVFSVDAVIYNDKVHNHLEKLGDVVKGLPELEKVFLLPYVRSKEEIDITGIPNCIFLDDFLRDVEDNPSLEFFQGSFCHPLFIMFSSGTTGPPKCMVHSAGGTLIQHLKEHVLHGNTTKDDIIIYYTTTGWMMWNWLVSALAVGAAVVLYDGSPLVPSYNVLWDLVDGLGITILGTGAKWLQALQEREVYPVKTHKLTSLHTILSTGSPLNSASYEYVYSSIKKDVVLGSITGGTDIISCFAGQNHSVPVYKGEIQARNLGMAVESWDCEGNRVFDASGELVCLKPFPSMPIYFWNDCDGKKYRKAYFEKFKGVWSHGDFCVISSVTGGIIMLGRSDGTLNPGGVRFGSAEIYNIVESSRFPEVIDSLCVGQSTDDGERVVLFVKLTESESELTEDLQKRIKSEIRQQLSARHVPSFILQTKDIPYTISGKKVEVAVKKILNGEHVTQRGALVNPDSLDLYYNIPQLVQT